MTPFGARVRELRRERGLLLKDMAAHLGVSSAYLSALERGERGKPTWTLLQGVLQYFRIIWDEADELLRLADLSDPKVKIDASAGGQQAVLLANRLAREFGALTDEDVAAILAVLDRAAARPRTHPSPFRKREREFGSAKRLSASPRHPPSRASPAPRIRQAARAGSLRQIAPTGVADENRGAAAGESEKPASDPLRDIALVKDVAGEDGVPAFVGADQIGAAARDRDTVHGSVEGDGFDRESVDIAGLHRGCARPRRGNGDEAEPEAKSSTRRPATVFG